MEISKEQREKIRKELINTYEDYGFQLYNGYDGLCGMIIEDFLDNVGEYEGSSYLEDICNSITGNVDKSYTCSTFKSAKIIADNIFEFNDIAREIEEQLGQKLNITETERNLIVVLLYICQVTILNQGCETLEELIEKLS